MNTDHLNIATELFAAIADGKHELLRTMYHDDLQAFQNMGERTLTKDQVLHLIERLRKHMPTMRYSEIDLQATDRGFVQRHRLTAERRDGTEISASVCVIADVQDAQIIRLWEYADSAAFS